MVLNAKILEKTQRLDSHQMHTFFWQINVDGYYRKDGTYVAPHHRSDPNGTTRDNWSTKGNVNPYTGEKGTKNPDQDGSVFSNPDSY